METKNDDMNRRCCGIQDPDALAASIRNIEGVIRTRSFSAHGSAGSGSGWFRRDDPVQTRSVLGRVVRHLSRLSSGVLLLSVSTFIVNEGGIFTKRTLVSTQQSLQKRCLPMT